ncbi:bifunctional precorrin-2 dehydrogenase/sirohydrochlorin ferrochelatase [Desulforhopalus vacuolatus]|uniref:precorrin-2 dehydrogenase/sirohydrochlorin ferrochelatase family protein n=1 Tax=Desulforhopalus vacuolatus TaxID=40414 RepID=UPI0019668882|nr:bifunctional precorrin-2 dehydrogenase/sirohydrochlorin ferrochelatase [Desulforhopalus vacuolatus]MBM9519928.1 bifunctional precorrin-2 dehydrogenase/sirohydrochlorin ferrochelatase [Desulforhopalus vacuolatus]
MALYPVNLNLKGKVCVVIGGGKVAARKVAGLCRGGAAVRLISPEIVDEIRPWLKGMETTPVEWFEREYALGDLQDVFLAFAATSSPAVQKDIREEAARRNVLLNIVDDPDKSGFHVPGHFRRGNVLVTASTGGESPALASSLRQRLEEMICPEYDLVNRLLGSVREALLAAGGTAGEHGRIFNELMSSGIVEQILQGEWFRVQQILCNALPPGVDGSKITAHFIEEGEEIGLIKPLSLR